MKNDLELKLILIVTRNLPLLRGAGVISNFLKNIYNRKPREHVFTDHKNIRFFLPTQSEFLFVPQIRDHNEIKYIKSVLKEQDIFVDIGANMGFYSLMAAQIVGPLGKILSIEADNDNYYFLQKNIELNNFSQIYAINKAVTNKKEKKMFYKNINNNELSSFVKLDDAIPYTVDCDTLLNLLTEHKLSVVNFLKIDAEGYDHRILTSFFNGAHSFVYPKYIMVENDESLESSNLLTANKYIIVFHNKNNTIFCKS